MRLFDVGIVELSATFDEEKREGVYHASAIGRTGRGKDIPSALRDLASDLEKGEPHHVCPIEFAHEGESADEDECEPVLTIDGGTIELKDTVEISFGELMDNFETAARADGQVFLRNPDLKHRLGRCLPLLIGWTAGVCRRLAYDAAHDENTRQCPWLAPGFEILQRLGIESKDAATYARCMLDSMEYVVPSPDEETIN